MARLIFLIMPHSFCRACRGKGLSEVPLSLIKVYFSSFLDTSDLGQSVARCRNFSRYNEEQELDASSHLLPHDSLDPPRSLFPMLSEQKGPLMQIENELIWIHSVVGMTGAVYLPARTSWDCQCCALRGLRKNYISVIVSP